MLSTILSYFNDFTRNNYSVLNENNIFNFIIATLEIVDDEQKEKIITNIKIFIGLRFYEQLKYYIFRKDVNNKLLVFFK